LVAASRHPLKAPPGARRSRPATLWMRPSTKPSTRRSATVRRLVRRPNPVRPAQCRPPQPPRPRPHQLRSPKRPPRPRRHPVRRHRPRPSRPASRPPSLARAQVPFPSPRVARGSATTHSRRRNPSTGPCRVPSRPGPARPGQARPVRAAPHPAACRPVPAARREHRAARRGPARLDREAPGQVGPVVPVRTVVAVTIAAVAAE